MKPEDQAAYAEIICTSFTMQEIRILENFANHFFNIVAQGKTVHLKDKLILDYMKEHGAKGGETDASKDG